MEYTIREMTVMEYPLLNEFLYEAIFIPDGIKPPPKNIIASPELQIYVDRFGASKADFALIAEVEQQIGFDIVQGNEEEWIMVCNL